MWVAPRSLPAALPPAPPPVREDRILVLPRAGQAAALANFHANERARVRRQLPRMGGLQIIELPAGTRPQDAVDRYRRSGLVEAADLDYQRWQPSATPNEPSFNAGTLWHLNNTGLAGGLTSADIDAAPGWDFNCTASNVIVAVVDTGIRYTHEDLAANMWRNPGESGAGRETNGIDDDNNGYIDDVHGIDAVTIIPALNGYPMDEWSSQGHGTHVAGILGAVGNNNLGVCGVAWRVQIMACKFISTSSGNDSDLIECLDYALSKGAHVINASIVGPGPASSMLSNAFWNVRQAGVVVCAAAGNNGNDNDAFPIYPGGFRMDNMMTVTATTRADQWVSSFNYGATSVHLAAPGYEILSTGRASDSYYFNNYGTSMATPCVAGAAALLRQFYPSESAQQIIARILANVDPLSSLSNRCVTRGRLNLRRAIDPASMATPAVSPAAFDWIPTNGMTRLTFATSDGVSGPHALPFAFPFGTRYYSQVWISANGLVGFTNTALGMGANYDLPMTNLPNAILCPYWDDLNPLAGGNVWFGTAGTAPNRKAVASWVAVPHQSMAGGGTILTFQAVLHESGHVSFQYQEVENGSVTLRQGKSATIGIEDTSGLFGTRYAFNGSPSLLTNGQALLFSPLAALHPAPGLRITSGPLAGQVLLQLSGEPGQPGAILGSTNLAAWSILCSNLLPASGLLHHGDTNASSANKFFRARSGPGTP